MLSIYFIFDERDREERHDAHSALAEQESPSASESGECLGLELPRLFASSTGTSPGLLWAWGRRESNYLAESKLVKTCF